jgi:hypothetical protein
MSGDNWKTVDAYLFLWSKFQPTFRVTFRVGLSGDDGDAVRAFIGKRFSNVSKKGIVAVELVRHSGAV